MEDPSLNPVRIIGAGLAGSEAAWQLANRNIPVHLYEMRPKRFSPAHHSDQCAELVCSNSLRADDWQHNAVGLLHQEMRLLDSLILASADANRTPAGGALATDRAGFSQWITERLTNHPHITLIREEITTLDANDPLTLIATGPLTSDNLATALQPLIGSDQLYFYDSLAPIVTLESIDFTQAFRQSRYNKGGADYINCPMNEAQYTAFITALTQAEQVPCRPFEKPIFFEGCLPIEVMAARGPETLRFGPMKPVGLHDPHQNTTPHAVVQLRQDNSQGTLWNLVGFQTKLTWPAQKELFRTIPGLENAEFARLGAIHRNTYINGPTVLDDHLRLKNHPNLFMAGQITGVEGYVESAACGLMAGRFIAHLTQHGHLPPPPPPETAHGALLRHVTHGDPTHFQPMNITFGLLPPITERCKKIERKPRMAKRALEALEEWKNT
ncbi:MAG: methylenetetrahydrofolate--tRNA-(uracil(54)-C(5))-methyltransferase (FADH(2)-oxidizing) TrmFO [Magnetococcales bacterium]|nr:methylenetetrahydrofolate--tRNA-(uracil(54)-C(5))-methyltransferase (FADH(2)-oxidizing) TrmFO [Magnetococcales bacterium]